MKNLRYAFLSFVLVLAGCAGQRAFHKEVAKIDTPAAYAKSVLEQHNVIGRQIVILRNDPGVSETSKTALRKLYRKSVCSSLEIAEDVETGACEKGPSYTADSAIAAYARLESAESEAEMQKAADELALIVAELLTAISNAR